jgi:putative nucleotidyltransferase with HDIG domain
MTGEDQDYIARLFPAIRKIQDEKIRQRVILTWYHAWKNSNFERIEDAHQFEPARDRIHYSNVEHTNQICLASEKMAEPLEEILQVPINMDFLLAGAVLHDVDKLVLFDAKSGGLREPARKFAHAETGASLALKEGLPEEVAHIIRAHSAAYSPIPPKSMEALILHHADLLVAKGVYLVKGLEMEKVLKESMARIAE